ncbi:unnamed protein product [Trichobilharzia szidati]|nr:unnamed protein product [Trichobilharzia szidati]CAH8862961.1 unnamed protein product [Trichobilharzia szidati]
MRKSRGSFIASSMYTNRSARRLYYYLSAGILIFLCVYVIYQINTTSVIVLNGLFDPVCQYKTKPIHKPHYHFVNDSVHIAMLLAGGIDNCYQAETQIKSLLFNQRRWYQSKDNCCKFAHFPHFNTDWLSLIEAAQYQLNNYERLTLVFHFIVDEKSYEFMKELMLDWNLDGIDVKYYDVNKYEKQIHSFKSGHYSGYRSYLKLLITQILPPEVDKVILLDSDMLFNDDIVKLWKLFNEFNEDQCIGIVAEQNPTFYSNMGHKFWPNLGFGYNAGLLLIDLAKLRKRQWDKLWMKVVFYLMKQKGRLPTAEQDVINAMLSQNKRWLYEIPCEWNIQLSAFSLRQRCPVVWKFIFSDKNQEEFNEVKTISLLKYPIAKLLHFNAHVKPEYFYPIPLRFPSATGRWNEYYSTIQLSRMYLQFYYNLRGMSRHCFI